MTANRKRFLYHYWLLQKSLKANSHICWLFRQERTAVVKDIAHNCVNRG